MTDEYIPIAEVELADDEIEAAVSVLESGYLAQGEQVDQFEEKFANAVGASHAVAVSSGTAALHLAYLSLIDDGDHVLVPAFSHISTASMVEFAGGRPIFCDIDPETFTLDVDDAQDRITEETTAIAPVHLYGNSCYIKRISDFADEHGLDVIWDAAQAHGTRYDGRDIGSFGDAVTYSFYPTKNMTTSEGGMLTTNDPDLAEEWRLLRSHWQTEKYRHPDVGLNYRMTDVEAAIGLKQLEKLDKFLEMRRDNAARLTEGLRSIPHVRTPNVPENVEHSYHQYTVVLKTDEIATTRNELISELDDRGIGAAVHYPTPIHEQPAFTRKYETPSLPICEEMARKVVSLPVHPGVNGTEINRIVDAIRAIVAK